MPWASTAVVMGPKDLAGSYGLVLVQVNKHMYLYTYASTYIYTYVDIHVDVYTYAYSHITDV